LSFYDYHFMTKVVSLPPFPAPPQNGAGAVERKKK
jgi:hypothetical protein